MGNVCCGGSEERPKASAVASIDSTSIGDAGPAQSSASQPSHEAASNQNNTGRSSVNQADTEVDKETSEEQSRLELLVQTAGRAMVPVRSARGSNPYYDQGFAAALAQHLEQTTQFPQQTIVLPAVPNDNKNSTVYTRLAQPVWDDLQLGDHDGLAGCAGEHPEKYLDRVAESFLDQVVPKKEQLFAKAKPIVESLL